MARFHLDLKARETGAAAAKMEFGNGEDSIGKHLLRGTAGQPIAILGVVPA